MKKLIVLIAALTLTSPLYAQPAAAATAEAGSVMSDGVVRKIDTANSKVTLKHGPIVNMDMPGMTMVFRVQSPDQLKNMKVGDAVKFHVEMMNGAMTVTQIQPVK
ncbi:MAG: copper-binding protein [Thiobacillus sp.]